MIRSVKRLSGNRLLLIGAIFSALLGSVSAEGLSLCVGPGSHVALEIPRAGCCPRSESPGAAFGLGQTGQECGECQDTPLSVGIGLTTHSAPSGSLVPAFIAEPLQLFSIAPNLLESPVPTTGSARPPWNGLRALILRC